MLTPDMRIRQVIDTACAQGGIELKPRVETDSVASLYALVGAGDCATIVPHTWLHALPVVSTTMFVPLVEPDVRAPISVAINAASPGSIAARAFVATAKGLGLNEFFERNLLCGLAEVDNPGLSANRR
jgi:DNA-binding transcriptional LysR family regulator